MLFCRCRIVPERGIIQKKEYVPVDFYQKLLSCNINSYLQLLLASQVFYVLDT